MGKNIEVLQAQLEQARRDVQHLEQMKEDALEDPHTFLDKLKANDLDFPQMQSIPRISDLDLSKYSKKTSRRGNTKYEQNLEYLVAKAAELHRRTSAVPPILLSATIPISSGMLAQPSPSITSQVRERFYEITGGPPMRPVSAPAPAFSGSDTPISSERVSPMPIGTDSLNASSLGVSMTSLSTSTEPSQPQPRTQRIHRVAMNENDYVAAHYNLPWSEEEKKRLEELMLVYPEEPVISRRHAKIAQALGTRTASQVTNRINKLKAKREKQAKRDSEAARDQALKLARTLKKSGVDLTISDADDLELEVDEATKSSAEYQEYLKLKEQMEDIKAQVVEHVGFKCDGCLMEPIIGSRFHCETCMSDFDLCQSCMTNRVDSKTGMHDTTHSFVKVTTAKIQPQDE